MRLFVYLLAAVSLVGVSGWSWWNFFLADTPVVSQETPARLLATEPEVKDPYWYRLPSIALSRVEETKLKGNMVVNLWFLLPDHSKQTVVFLHMRRVRDVLIELLYGLYALKWLRVRGMESRIVRQKILRTLEKVVGTGVVADVYIETFPYEEE